MSTLCNAFSLSIPEDATEAIYEQPPDHDDSSSDDSDPYSKIDADLSPQHILSLGMHISCLLSLSLSLPLPPPPPSPLSPAIPQPGPFSYLSAAKSLWQ